MVTCKKKIGEIPMPTWVIQRVEAIVICYGQDISNRYEPLFIELFFNENDFSAALHEGGITGVVQENNEKDNDNDDDGRNTEENPVELTGVAPPENEVDDNFVPPLLPSEYDRNNESDGEDEDTETPTQQ